MRVVVAGAGGMVGREVTELFESRGHHEVSAFMSADLDITDRDAVLQRVAIAAPDVVINCAAFTAVDACETEVDRAFQVNGLGVRNLAEACAAEGAHLVHIGTDYVFDGTKPTPYHEWDAPHPMCVYATSKLAGEHEAVALLGPACTIARISWVCGRYGSNMVKTVLRVAAASDGPLRFVDDQRGCPTFANDLATMLYRFAVERRPGLFHVTNQRAVSWFEFVQEILQESGDDPKRVEPISTADLQPPRPAPRPANSVLDNLALRLSGIELLPDHGEALARCIKQLA
ncbi:MAG TPA: dTDP-4-dehydrorhamnose reductase [Acidimicrobiia bacterium]